MRFESKIYTKVSDTIRQAQEELFLYYFQRCTQKEIGNRYGQIRSTAGLHIQLPLHRYGWKVIAHERGAFPLHGIYPLAYLSFHCCIYAVICL